MVKLRKYLIYLFFVAIGFFGYQNPAFANHAGAIEISKNMYSIFLYILIPLGVSILFVFVRIQKVTKQLNSLTVEGSAAKDLRYQRKFLSISSIMLLIGFLSVGAIYLFLRSAAIHP